MKCCPRVQSLLCWADKVREVSSGRRPEISGSRFRALDYVKITVFGFALSALWSSLHLLILPLRLLEFVPEGLKNTYLDLLILSGLVLAMLVQPVAGALSDRSGLAWGRRRPYILLGTIPVLLLLPGIGLAGSYAAIFLVYCLLQVGSNVAQGPFQGLIPDLVPEGRRGVASGVRSLLNLVGGIALIRLIAPYIDRYFSAGERPWLWIALAVPAVIVLGAAIATLLTVREQPGPVHPRLPLWSTIYGSFNLDTRAHPDFVLFLVACFLMFMAWGTLLAHALYYLMDVADVASPGEVTGDLLIAVGICMLAVVYPAGRLSDRIGRKPIAISSGVLGALGVLALFFSQNYIHIILSGGLLGIGGGAWISSQWALATDLVGRGEEARHLGLVNMSIAGAGAASRLVGPAIDFLNTRGHNLGYQVMLLVCFACLVIGALLLLKVKERHLAK